MELIYLWVDNYKNIHKQGFNFSPNFDVEFTPVYENNELSEKSEIKITPKENPLRDFFGENINITAIVGENGVGKTNILDLLKNKNDKNTNHKRKYFYAYYDHIKKEPYCYGSIEIKGVSKSYLPLSSVSILSHNEMLSTYNLYDLQGSKKDFSIFQKLDQKYNYFDNNIFIPKYINFIRKLNISNINFDTLRIILDEPILNNEINIDIDQLLCKKLIKKLNIDSKISSYDEIIKHYEDDKNDDMVLALKTLKQYSPKIANYAQMHIYFDLPIKKDNLFNQDINSLYILQKMVPHESNISKELFDLEILNSHTSATYTSISAGEKNLLRLQVENLYHRDSGHMDEVDLGNKFLSIYSYDEVEASFHPSLQKKILSKCIETFKYFKNHKFNLIFATHSPFILSDIPQENIIFLEKDKETGNCINAIEKMKDFKTFGANIHTLLADGFFMSDGLMGEFAKSKIEEIKNFYDKHKNLKSDSPDFLKIKQEYEKNKTNFENIQKIIGEPFLQTIIKNYLDELEILFYGKKEFLKKEIERLQNIEKSLDNA